MNKDLPPQDLTAEEAVLGACLLDPEAIDVAAGIVSAMMFYAEKNRIVWNHLVAMHNAGKKIDPVTVADALSASKQFDEVGGAHRIEGLMAATPATWHVDTHAEIVRDRWRRRTATDTGREIIVEAYDLSRSTEEILHEAEAAIHAALEGGTQDTVRTIEETLIEIMSPAGQSRIQPLSTGFVTLDGYSGGVTPGQLVVLAARTSAGKSAFAATLARRMAETGVNSLIVSYEMSRLEIAERMLLGPLNVDTWTFRRAHGKQQLQTDILQQSAILGALPINVDESKPALTQLLAMLRIQVRRRKTRLVIIDYLQLIPFVGRAGNREQEIAQITRQLKNAAGQLGIVIIALSQLNRDVEKRESQRPRLSDLRESGAIEQDADQVWLLWRPNMSAATSGNNEAEPDNIGELILAKNRGGQLGIVPLSWHGPTMVYRDRGEVLDAVNHWGAA